MSHRIYEANAVAAFMRSKERYGDLSNMTWGMPVVANDIPFQSSEGLYQAFKYPESLELQRAIGAARSGMDAKKVAYTAKMDLPGDEWDDIRIDAMRYALAQKLRYNPVRFGNALRETGDRDIVEMSYRDAFWGAKPQGRRLVGENRLGRLLTELRDLMNEYGDANYAALEYIDRTDTHLLTINGRPASL